MNTFPKIKNHESERLNFREMKPMDATQLFEIYSDAEAMKYRHNPPMKSMEDAKAFIQNQKLETDTHYKIRKGVVIKESNELIGSVMYKFSKLEKTECIIGYSIGAKYWGRGFGREIVKFLVESIEALGSIKQIKAWTIQENVGSNRILEINGFETVAQEEFPESYLFVRNI